MSRSITIIQPGLATSVQDAGRAGYYHLGVPPSGAMDQYSFKMSNLLVGNDENAAVLECTFLAPEIRFNCDAVFAVAGAECQPIINDEEKPTHTAISVSAGDVVKFSFMQQGARAYIAIAGGIDVPEVLGSRSTYGLGAIGGFNGRKLMADDDIPVGEAAQAFVERSVPAELRQTLAKSFAVRVMPGLYNHRLTAESEQGFYEDEWTVAPEADRIGYRFKGGNALTFKARTPPFGAGADPSNIVDAPYAIGSIQVPSGKEPIILHRDAVSGGGYAMIATVISADMDIIGQMQPNHRVKFMNVTMDEALAARKAYREKLEKLRTLLV